VAESFFTAAVRKPALSHFVHEAQRDPLFDLALAALPSMLGSINPSNVG
jgi:hypothetical protein